MVKNWDDIERVAFHEAAHAVIGRILGGDTDEASIVATDDYNLCRMRANVRATTSSHALDGWSTCQLVLS
jgi:hypothetical protein